MKRLLVALVAAVALGLAPRAQEIVVFRDFRSLSVVSHRVEGRWTYLRVAEGELAVLTTTILEYRKEPAGSSQPAPPAGPPQGAAARPWTPEPSAPAREPDPPEEYNPPPEEPPPPPELAPAPEAKPQTED